MKSGQPARRSANVAGGSACLYGCLAAVAIVVILSAVGGWALFRATDGGESLTGGMTLPEAFRTGRCFIGGLMNGSIRPEAGIAILSRLFIDMSDGVLTKEEIRGILEHARRACDVRL